MGTILDLPHRISVSIEVMHVTCSVQHQPHVYYHHQPKQPLEVAEGLAQSECSITEQLLLLLLFKVNASGCDRESEVPPCRTTGHCLTVIADQIDDLLC